LVLDAVAVRRTLADRRGDPRTLIRIRIQRFGNAKSMTKEISVKQSAEHFDSIRRVRLSRYGDIPLAVAIAADFWTAPRRDIAAVHSQKSVQP